MNFVGIDLGTTNSAICSYDGETVRLYKSPEQHDVTPSALFIDRRGNKYIGARAYNNAARNPECAALTFKRLMGTSTPIKFDAAGLVMSPEECSAEILRALYAYLPESVQREAAGAVITVPAAFNQMQKDATMSASDRAGIGQVALMQEPVAAVMSVMRQRKSDGIFLVYDLGGGTLDVAVAECTAGRVSLLAHGGIEMCGGRDFDRLLFDRVLRPWLEENFDLPQGFESLAGFKSLRQLATWAGEKAKIELSQRPEAIISLPETELGLRDQSGKELYIDRKLSRTEFDDLISSKIADSIRATEETIEKAHISARDVDRIVFVGGPTNYEPLRNRVASSLGISPSTEVNPMIAVAEGAAIFAESIDWQSQTRGRKSARGQLSASGKLVVAFSYVSRTPDARARMVAKVEGQTLAGTEFQVDSMDSGWTSGRVQLSDGATIELPLAKPGANAFKVFVFDAAGGPVPIPNDRIAISRISASVDAIPASHSIGLEARKKVGGPLILVPLVKEGEALPKRGSLSFKAEESLKAGGANSIKFKLWEGGIVEPIDDNRFIGMFEIKGSDFEEGVIAAGADLECKYEVLDSGNIILAVDVPSIRGSFQSGRNFYSRREGQIDFTKASKRIDDEATRALNRVEEMSTNVDDERLDHLRKQLTEITELTERGGDPEAAKQAMDRIQEAKRILAQTRKDHLRDIHRLDLAKVVEFFDKAVRAHARPSEQAAFDNLARTAQRTSESNNPDFESQLEELRGKNFMILWRQDWFVIDMFKQLSRSPYLFPDANEHRDLVGVGMEALEANDMDKLRAVVVALDSMRIGRTEEHEMVSSANIVQR